jgi:ribosome biogenesis GTPase
MNGRIVALDFGHYLVDVNGSILSVGIAKTLRKKQQPIVGDYVTLSPSCDMIESINPRRTWIIRPRVANVDLILIVSSLVEPVFSRALLMMFMSFASYYSLPYALVFSKVDRGDLTPLQEILTYCQFHGISVFTFNKFAPNISEQLATFIRGKTVAFAGQTGVGKSSIINVINPDFQRQIGSYSEALGRGRHETKEVRMVPYQNGYIVDTPGFSSIILPTLKNELASMYPGFAYYVGQCKFANCLHLDEPGCKIKADVELGKIPLTIYETYVSLLESCLEKKEYV